MTSDAPPLTGILEVEELSYLEALADKYESQNGSRPFDLSHWDPSTHVMNALLMHLRLPDPPSAAPYIHSHYVHVRQQVLQRLGFLSPNVDCLLINSGTNATLFGVAWLKALNISRVVIICPAYFPVFHAARMMGLPYRCVYMHRESGEWVLPCEEVLDIVKEAPSETAIWVTNPVFCTGEYLSEVDTGFLDSLITSGAAIVADECLAIGGHELGKALAGSDRFLGLYSPHKSLCINAVKFAAMVFNVKHQMFFDHWTDVLAGGLCGSSYSAIMHFLGDNFSSFQSKFFEYIDNVREEVVSLIRSWNTLIQADEKSIGHFMSCYAIKIPGSEGKNKVFLQELVSNTGAIVIPGVRNYFGPDVGFSFRINLARSSPQFSSALHRTIDYLARISDLQAE